MKRSQDKLEPSRVSVKSHRSKPLSFNFNEESHSSEKRFRPEGDDLTDEEMTPSIDDSVHSKERDSFIKKDDQACSQFPSGQSAQENQTHIESIFKMVAERMDTFMKDELKTFQKFLSPNYSECLERQRDGEEVIDAVGEEQRRSNRESLLNLTLFFLRSLKQEELADVLQSKTLASICQNKLKSNLKEKFKYLSEGTAKAGNPNPLLNEIYTELYITEGGSEGVNDEHEVRQIEMASTKTARPDALIKCEDIFEPLPGRDKQVRTLMTNGVAGIGKTVLTQKFTLDWAEDKANQQIQFAFPFTFRELNLLKEKEYSLVELLHNFFVEIKEAGISRFDKFQVVFIFDGLDECRLPLDFKNNEILTDVKKSVSVDVLLTNLIKGKLLPSARLWITTRPAAANQIPPECVDMMTEVRGFTDEQKEEYFKKRFKDEEQASRIISHIKTSRSLHIMCHMPVFCWISATVLEHVLKTDKRVKMPKTLTEMYILFLAVQSKIQNVKYRGRAETDPVWNPETREMILSLGKLAFEQLEKGNLIFYEADLKECGIDVEAASVYSGVFTQIFKEESGLYLNKVFCFVHLSIQEFLAAVHIFVSFINTGVNHLSETSTSPRSMVLRKKCKVKDLYQSAVDKALQSPNGHLDLFLRFLFGLSLETSQTVLRGLLTQTGSSSQATKETVEFVKEKIRENPSPERSINLFHCLKELNDNSLVDEIQQYLRSGRHSTEKLSPAQWSALVFMILSSEEELDVFVLKKYSASEEGLLRLLPVVKASNKSVVSGFKLSERSCEALASVLSAKSSNLRELDLSNNDLKDSGVEKLCVELKSPQCRLDTLRMSVCKLSERGCEALASVLSSESSSVRELDLSNNDLKDSGVEKLCAGLTSPHSKLCTLRLSGCLITKKGCDSLASALSSSPSCLRELDLSYNHPEDSGMKLLSELKDLHCSLEPGSAQWLQSGLQKYACELTLDPNTAHRNLSLSTGNTKVTVVKKKQSYCDQPERFDYWKQLLCGNGLTGRCYWEVKRKGEVHIGVTYSGIRRKGEDAHCTLGGNDKSWSLYCSDDFYTAWHNTKTTDIRVPPSSGSDRVAVYLDWPAGSLSFYLVSSDTLIHLHTFKSEFTEPLYPAFGFLSDSSVSLCQIE